MAEDSTAPSEGAQAPTAETPAAPTPDTAENTPQAQPVDWQERYRNLQADHTRQAQARAEAERRLAELQTQLTASEDEEEPETPTVPRQTRKVDLSAELARERAAREQLEWQVAEGVYGPEVLGAYDSAAGMIQAATTVTDTIAAFEAYHQARSAGASPAQAAAAPAQAPSQTEAAAPRVLAPRPDDAQAERLYLQEVEAARQKGGDAGLRALIGASLKKAGLAD